MGAGAGAVVIGSVSSISSSEGVGEGSGGKSVSFSRNIHISQVSFWGIGGFGGFLLGEFFLRGEGRLYLGILVALIRSSLLAFSNISGFSIGRLNLDLDPGVGNASIAR